MKWKTLIRFIKKHRKQGDASFMVVTTSDTFIIWAHRFDSDKNAPDDTLRIKYK